MFRDFEFTVKLFTHITKKVMYIIEEIRQLQKNSDSNLLTAINEIMYNFPLLAELETRRNSIKTKTLLYKN